MAWNGIAILHTDDIKMVYEYLLVKGKKKACKWDISWLRNISVSVEFPLPF